MSETEIELARTYLLVSGQDPVAALIRSVRDLARLRRRLAGQGDAAPSPFGQGGPGPSILGPRDPVSASC